MTYRHTTITYSGLALDAFMTSDENTWLTLTSLASGLNLHRQTVQHWLTRKLSSVPESIDVRVGIRNTPTKAYSVDIAADFIEYMADKGNIEAKALRSATLRSDIKRFIKEANGIQMTAAQHEKARHLTRLELLRQWARNATDNGQVPLSVEDIKEGGFTDTIEREIVFQEGVISRLEVKLLDGEMDREEAKATRYGIESRQEEVQRLSN